MAPDDTALHHFCNYRPDRDALRASALACTAPPRPLPPKPPRPPAPPAPPALGRSPRQGLCSYCHYRTDEPGLSESMSDAFHREVMEVGR